MRSKHRHTRKFRVYVSITEGVETFMCHADFEKPKRGQGQIAGKWIELDPKKYRAYDTSYPGMPKP